jgi:hypothetical protein
MFASQEEKDQEIFRYKNFIADKVVDLQKFPMEIKDAEDQENTEKIIKKIEDTCADIKKGYVRLEDVMYAEVEDAGGSMYNDEEGFY